MAAFALVGALGFAVQLTVLHALTAAGVPVPLAAPAAVLAALVHNFGWHGRWTWRDRARRGRVGVRFARFVASNGAISLTGNVALTVVLSAHGVPVLAANTLAVLACSAANFAVADRRVFAVAAAVILAAPHEARAAELTPETLAAWGEYVRATEARVEAGSAQPSAPDRAELERLRRGELLVDAGTGADNPVPVPGGLIHHWRARVVLLGVQLDAVLRELQAPTSRRWLPADVRSMRVSTGPSGSLLVAMRLARGGIVPVTYDTEHDVRYTRLSPVLATSRSISTRIVEVADPGTPRERALPPGDDRGFLWRLNAYWRYTQLPDGVLVECESLSLSRGVPALLRPIAAPIIDGVSRDSLRATMTALQRGFAGSQRPN